MLPVGAALAFGQDAQFSHEGAKARSTKFKSALKKFLRVIVASWLI
jgi:hypothetical protein